MNIYKARQAVELFHLLFLNQLGRKLDKKLYALKGGCNMRFYFHSIRYSEDMDLDVQKTGIGRIQKAVMDILLNKAFSDNLESFGIRKIIPPDMTKAKQTETTQRFKIHLLTQSGEDLFTKVEFSRRGPKGLIKVEPVYSEILRAYKMPPLLVPHYEAPPAIEQKIHALAHRSVLQARDIFDLFLLSSHYHKSQQEFLEINGATLKTAHDNIFLVEFPQFRDTVAAYLGAGDQKIYSSSAVWDEIKLNVSRFLEEFSP